MIKKTIRVRGAKVCFEWHPDPTGDGGLVSMLPGVADFHADSYNDAIQIIRSLYRRDPY